MVSREEKKAIATAISKRDAQLWSALKPDQRDRLVKVVHGAVVTSVQHTTSVYSGPIPSPSMFSEYNSAIPDGANRVMKMAEEQSRHRIALERETVASQNRQSARGQVFAFICVILLIAAGAYSASIGQTAVACTIFGSTVVGMGTVFALGKKAMRKSLEEKSKGS